MNGYAERSVAKAVGWGVAICGTLDIADALIFYGVMAKVPAKRLLENIASGLLGRSAFTGGWGTAALGLAVHYCIAAAWVTMYVLLAQRVRWMFEQPVAAGALYGLVVYGVMNYVVLPMTRVGASRPAHGWVLVNAVGALLLFMGVAVGLVNRRFGPVSVLSRR